MKSDDLSRRGHLASQSIPRIDIEVYFEALQNLYDPDLRPDGALPLNMAENKLCWPELQEKIQNISKQKVPDWVAGYTAPGGHDSVRAAISEFYARHISGHKLNVERIALSSGATGVIEATAFALGEPGDIAVFPAPCYPVYSQDIHTVAGLQRHDLHTHHELFEIWDGPLLSIDHLEKTREALSAQNQRFRILVITNPDNPTGGMYSKAQLVQMAQWCADHKIHLIVNEIYALSLIDTKEDDIAQDYSHEITFHSFAGIIQEIQSPHLHLWYSFSKDFGISGLRLGFLYSLNETLLQAFQNINLGRMCSNHTQWLLQEILQDQTFVDQYIMTNQKRLTENYTYAVNTMRDLNIPYVPARGSLFLWIDLSEFLMERTQEAENKFWMHLYESTGILLTPGQGFGHTKRGQFRIVHSFLNKEHFMAAMKKFTQFIIDLRK